METYLSGLYSITELAERFGVSRQKLHKWLARHNVDGMKGLVDRSRAPVHIPHRTSEPMVEQILAFRRRFRTSDRARSSRDSPNYIRLSTGRRRAPLATFFTVPA
ncbi:MAG: hypothetical protein DMF56_23835 [Acidobacteria bacterium]|nr:MAG: hypothetical protein DMF56_23835 [Acidobacteriota bacterium]